LEKNIYREQEGTRVRKGQGEVGIIFVTEQAISLIKGNLRDSCYFIYRMEKLVSRFTMRCH